MAGFTRRTRALSPPPPLPPPPLPPPPLPPPPPPLARVWGATVRRTARTTKTYMQGLRVMKAPPDEVYRVTSYYNVTVPLPHLRARAGRGSGPAPRRRAALRRGRAPRRSRRRRRRGEGSGLPRPAGGP